MKESRKNTNISIKHSLNSGGFLERGEWFVGINHVIVLEFPAVSHWEVHSVVKPSVFLKIKFV